METKILLESSKGFNSVNKPLYPIVDLQQKVRCLPYNGTDEIIDKYQLFTEERDKCENYRLFFTINPICSNILFNMRTEVVYKEGSDECQALVSASDKISNWEGAENVNNETNISVGIPQDESRSPRMQTLRDTEYSHPNLGQFVYHCGIDIFNNHLLRTDDFIHINKLGSNISKKSTEKFNTLEDIKRDKDGNEVSEVLLDRGDTTNTTTPVQPHLYQLDNFKVLDLAVEDSLIVKNGWFGFVNKTGIDIPNGKKGESLNKIMNNNMACEIYNMYPDISLFSFTPKMNKYRKRLETNWNYCLTYPKENDQQKFIEIMGGKGIKAVKTMISETSYGEEAVCIVSMIRHNLKKEDKVFVEWNDGYKDNHETITVLKVGDFNGENTDTCFLVPLISSLSTSKRVNFRKIENGIPCKYYLRRFAKMGEYSSELNKLAYGENIYGDKLTQLAYSDTISIKGFKDNLGRPLSEIYLTIIKNNKGYKEWYEGKRYNDENVEYSHCFGKITSGINIKEPSAPNRYNVRKVHNITKKDTLKLYNTIELTEERLEDDITINSKDWFYGDIVEFSPDEAKETVLEKIYHRFNTAQREDINNKDILFDEIESDDYDEKKSSSSEAFKIQRLTMKDGAIQPEGYFYSPHYRVKLKEVNDYKEESHSALIDVIKPVLNIVPRKDESGEMINTYEFSFDTTYDYNYVRNDTFAVYDFKNDKIIWGLLTKSDKEWDVEKLKYIIHITLELTESINYSEENFDVLLTDGSVPLYATYIPISEKFVWRRILKPSETTKTSDIYDIPFSNGSFYIENNLNFFLRRQDPFNEYGLNVYNFLDNFPTYDDTSFALDHGLKERESSFYDNYCMRTLKNILRYLDTEQVGDSTGKYLLSEITVHYSTSDNVLHPNQDNSCYITANYSIKKKGKSRSEVVAWDVICGIVSTSENVTTTDGKKIVWDRGKYGTKVVEGGRANVVIKCEAPGHTAISASISVAYGKNEVISSDVEYSDWTLLNKDEQIILSSGGYLDVQSGTTRYRGTQTFTSGDKLTQDWTTITAASTGYKCDDSWVTGWGIDNPNPPKFSTNEAKGSTGTRTTTITCYLYDSQNKKYLSDTIQAKQWGAYEVIGYRYGISEMKWEKSIPAEGITFDERKTIWVRGSSSEIYWAEGETHTSSPIEYERTSEGYMVDPKTDPPKYISYVKNDPDYAEIHFVDFNTREESKEQIPFYFVKDTYPGDSKAYWWGKAQYYVDANWEGKSYELWSIFGNSVEYWTIEQGKGETTHSLTEPTITYSNSMNYLHPDNTVNYAKLSAKYNTIVDGVIVSSEVKEVTPDLSRVSDEDKQWIILDGNFIKWATDTKGTVGLDENKPINGIAGVFSDLTTEETTSVTVGANKVESSTEEVLEYKEVYMHPEIVQGWGDDYNIGTGATGHYIAGTKVYNLVSTFASKKELREYNLQQDKVLPQSYIIPSEYSDWIVPRGGGRLVIAVNGTGIRRYATIEAVYSDKVANLSIIQEANAYVDVGVNIYKIETYLPNSLNKMSDLLTYEYQGDGSPEKYWELSANGDVVLGGVMTNYGISDKTISLWDLMMEYGKNGIDWDKPTGRIKVDYGNCVTGETPNNLIGATSITVPKEGGEAYFAIKVSELMKHQEGTKSPETKIRNGSSGDSGPALQIIQKDSVMFGLRINMQYKV